MEPCHTRCNFLRPTSCRLAGLVALVAVLLSCSTSSRTVGAQEPVGGPIEIVIQEYAYQVRSGVLKTGEPATIHLTNSDSVTHGFQWAFLEQEQVRIEGGGVTTYTAGFRRLHLQPHEEVRIHFTPMRRGKFTFKCDIHPGMEGEVFILKVGEA